MADKSAKDKETSKPAEGEKKAAVNKQTAKVMQDGVELTWDLQREGDLDADAAAKFYAQSVDALRKFRETDPRTMPELRAEAKRKKEFWAAFGHRTNGVFIGLLLAVVLYVFAGAGRGCEGSSREGSHRYHREAW